MSDALNVLSLQPWYGGSHRNFNDGWAANSRHHWETIGLPGQNWKWRMRYAAIELGRKVEARAAEGANWDVVICSDMLNAAELQAFAPSIRGLPLVCYFHENQFAYPNRGQKQPDHHFLFTNFVSALVADEIWFNSRFNLTTLLQGIDESSSRWPDFDVQQDLKKIELQARVMPPGIAIPDLDFDRVREARRERVAANKPLRLLWAARFEHDKNPDDLLKTLDLLVQQGVTFELSVIGERAAHPPESMQLIRDRHGASIINWGYQESREAYWSVLCDSDIFVSTAQHEFYGISVAESIIAGCWPLLPNRQAYPEVLAGGLDVESFMYHHSAKQLAQKIRQLHLDRNWDWAALDSHSNAKKKLDWKRQASKFDDVIENLGSRTADP